MPRSFVTCWLFATLSATAAGAVVDPLELDAVLREKQFTLPELEAVTSLLPATALPGDSRTAALAGLGRLGVRPEGALLDPLGGRWATLRPATPLIPGTGRDNDLSWEDFGSWQGAGDEALLELAWTRVTHHLYEHAEVLQVAIDELAPRGAWHGDGGLVQFSAARTVAGLPVRGARFTAVLSQGNLVLLGAQRWGDVTVDLTPRVSSAAALAAVAEYLRPLAPGELREPASLALLPTYSGADFAIGAGYDHRLAWVLQPEVPGSVGRWEALVDAHDGRLLAFRDLNQYGLARNVKGGVYPYSDDGTPPDGTMVAGYPMPFTDLSSGGFTDAGGNFSAAGDVTTTLDGQFVRIQDVCGAISETSDGDIDLEGADGDDNCDAPPGHSPGDTSAARTTFYELNRLREMAASHLPANAWLNGQLTGRTNEQITCAATWNGTEVIFYWHNDPCANTGQNAAVIDHEWGHGLDDNDVNGSIPPASQGGGGGFADLIAAVRHNRACVGRGFFTDDRLCSGYGDPCTEASGCDGVRTVDFADRTSGLPHTLTWVRQFCQPDTPQCLGAAYAEAIWDLWKRDLPALYGMDDNTALEVVTRLLIVGSGAVSGWFDRSGPAPGDAGCGANQAYLQFLATDDDDGDIDNGTPHMTAIAAAFDRHEIGCTPGGATPGPVVQDSGCANTPTTAPVVTADATDMGADLAWSAVPDAAQYKIFRTDGERQCELAKALAGTTTGTTFADTGLQNGRDYSYVVIPMGAGGDTCFGPASSCVTVGDDSIFADGFESGDTSAWSSTVP
jgi:hypothetical protein